MSFGGIQESILWTKINQIQAIQWTRRSKKKRS